jgi:hypothetical protein
MNEKTVNTYERQYYEKHYQQIRAINMLLLRHQELSYFHFYRRLFGEFTQQIYVQFLIIGKSGGNTVSNFCNGSFNFSILLLLIVTFILVSDFCNGMVCRVFGVN